MKGTAMGVMYNRKMVHDSSDVRWKDEISQGALLYDLLLHSRCAQ